MQFSHSFSMGMHVKLHTPVPLSGVSEVIAIFTNGCHWDSGPFNVSQWKPTTSHVQNNEAT